MLRADYRPAELESKCRETKAALGDAIDAEVNKLLEYLWNCERSYVNADVRFARFVATLRLRHLWPREELESRSI